MNKLANEPIFPSTREKYVSNPMGEDFLTTESVPGLTKREYFAGLAMQSFISTGNGRNGPNFSSKRAVEFADALLEQLSLTSEK